MIEIIEKILKKRIVKEKVFLTFDSISISQNATTGDVLVEFKLDNFVVTSEVAHAVRFGTGDIITVRNISGEVMVEQ